LAGSACFLPPGSASGVGLRRVRVWHLVAIS